MKSSANHIMPVKSGTMQMSASFGEPHCMLLLVSGTIASDPDQAKALELSDAPPEGHSSLALEVSINREAALPHAAWELRVQHKLSPDNMPDSAEMAALILQTIQALIAQLTDSTHAPDFPATAVPLRLSEAPRHQDPAPVFTRIVEQAMLYIQENIHQRLTMKQAAASVGLCMQHFCRVFSEETGVPFSKYVAQIRTKRAAELMKSSNMSIKEIAYQVGFGSIAQFNRQFKRWQGVCPTSLRTK